MPGVPAETECGTVPESRHNRRKILLALGVFKAYLHPALLRLANQFAVALQSDFRWRVLFKADISVRDHYLHPGISAIMQAGKKVAECRLSRLLVLLPQVAASAERRVD